MKLLYFWYQKSLRPFSWDKPSTPPAGEQLRPILSSLYHLDNPSWTRYRSHSKPIRNQCHLIQFPLITWNAMEFVQTIFPKPVEHVLCRRVAQYNHSQAYFTWTILRGLAAGRIRMEPNKCHLIPFPFNTVSSDKAHATSPKLISQRYRVGTWALLRDRKTLSSDCCRVDFVCKWRCHLIKNCT